MKKTYWKDFENGDLYEVTSWNENENQWRDGVYHVSANVKCISGDGICQGVIAPPEEFFVLEKIATFIR